MQRDPRAGPEGQLGRVANRVAFGYHPRPGWRANAEPPLSSLLFGMMLEAPRRVGGLAAVEPTDYDSKTCGAVPAPGRAAVGNDRLLRRRQTPARRQRG